MTVKQAAMLVVQTFPGRYVTGYWVEGDNYIFNTKSLKAMRGDVAPSQFVVTKSGEIYATNPFRYNLDPKKMRKI